MSGVSPSSVLFSSDGTELAVVRNAAYIAGTRGILMASYNVGNGNTELVPSGQLGGLYTISSSNTVSIQTAATVTASGNAGTIGYNYGQQEVALVVNVGTVTGAGSIQYTIREVDPGDNATLYGNSATTVVINSGNAPGVFTAVMPVTTSNQFLITWTVTGTFSATIYSTVTSKETPFTQTVNGTVAVSSVAGTVTVSGTVTSNQGTPNTLANAWPIRITDGYGNLQGSAVNPIFVTGSISATNPSVGTDGATALGFDTQVGGKTTTAAPTYVTGNLDALSLTTLGGLRIDGVYAVATANATAADVMNSGGYVTTAAPTYTTGQLNPLSLTTTGSLRVDGGTGTFNNQSVGTDAAAALGFDTQVGGKVTTAAPTYTTGNLDALSLTTLGGLRIDGVYAVGTANATAADVGSVGGYVTTAAPTYTTGQLNPLSLDTAGNLRVTGTVTTDKGATATLTSVAGATSNTTVLASNAARINAAIYNNTNKNMYIKYGTTASTSSFSVVLMKNSYLEILKDYTGEIDAVWDSGVSGSALVTELTP